MAVFRWDRIQRGPDGLVADLFLVPPDVAIEVVSAKQSVTSLIRKCLWYVDNGVPMALYTDRAHWAVHTPTSGSAPDRRHPTQVGRALARLGVEHILGYSPQARGRSERMFGFTHKIEAYTLPFAVFALLVGLLELRIRPDLGSWLGYGPAHRSTSSSSAERSAINLWLAP